MEIAFSVWFVGENQSGLDTAKLVEKKNKQKTRQKKHPSVRPESAFNPVTVSVQPLNPDHAPSNPIPNSRAGWRDIWKP